MKANRKFILVSILILVIGLLTASLAFAGEGDGAATWASSGVVGEATGAQGVSAGGNITITQSVDPVTVVPGSVACSPDQGASTTENSYWRVFDLATDFGIVGNFNVSNVQFGVENATNSGSTTVNLYTLSGPLNTANLTLIGTGSFNIADGTLFLYDAAVAGTAPAGSTLVVEISSPDLSGVGRFFIGSNAAGQNDPSYISSGSCGLTQPTNFADIGFPDIHIVMSVSGTETAPPSIALTKTVGVTPGVCATTDTITVPGAGADVYYCYEVMNTGTVTLSLHDLVDDQLGTIFTGFAYDLGPGASVDTVAAGLEISATITQTTVNSATWTAYNNSQESASANATATVNVSSTPTSVSLSGFGSDASAFSPIWFVALLAILVGFGLALHRKMTT